VQPWQLPLAARDVAPVVAVRQPSTHFDFDALGGHSGTMPLPLPLPLCYGSYYRPQYRRLVMMMAHPLNYQASSRWTNAASALQFGAK